MTPKVLLGALVEAAREVRRVNEAQREYTRQLQAIAAEARKTGESQSHRIPPKVYDYGAAVAALLDALEKYEARSQAPSVGGRTAREVAHGLLRKNRCGDVDPIHHTDECDRATAAIEADRAASAARLEEARGFVAALLDALGEAEDPSSYWGGGGKESVDDKVAAARAWLTQGDDANGGTRP
jgi:hypothetical protein